MNTKLNPRELARKLISSMISHDSEEWPPSCLAIVYQPVRPTYLPELDPEKYKTQDATKL